MSVPLAFEWRNVLFANWPVAPSVIEERLPAALSAETYDGNAWLSIIPFVNVDTRLRGLPKVAGITIPELNLRTYVTCDDEPGIYFFSLDMASVLGVLGARLTHHLPYFYARTKIGEHDSWVSVASRRLHFGDRPAHFEATYRPTGGRFEADPGSLTEFLTERRRLYTQAQDGSVRYTEVEHERWPLYEAEYRPRKNTVFEANGFEHPDSEPTLYFSPGVSVTTTRSKRWRRA